MTKTTFEGWSLEKHSEFVKRLDGPRHRLVRKKQESFRAELSKALGYSTYNDMFGYNHDEMVKAMSTKDDWFKYGEKEFG
ncbi:MAG: hypothetical protein KJ597_06360 [Nanoarchaeota archaeon]|nr:hypothetical protein [Nanoarchaeota archaeon]MBU1623170.1 hypothetical protein [Nanoarchaeota archaeon]